MVAPRIVFCDKNHIYDASLYGSCPYCKRIEQEQKELRVSVGKASSISGPSRPNRKAVLNKAEEDITELLSARGESQESTEQLRTERRQDVVSDEQTETTELLWNGNEEKGSLYGTTQDITELLHKEKNNNIILPKEDERGSVLGWFVIKEGLGRGHSVEVCENTGFLYNTGNAITALSEETEQYRLIAQIRKKELIEITPASGAAIKINGTERRHGTFLHSYDTIEIGKYKLVYVELLTQLMGWSI